MRGTSVKHHLCYELCATGYCVDTVKGVEALPGTTVLSNAQTKVNLLFNNSAFKLC